MVIYAKGADTDRLVASASAFDGFEKECSGVAVTVDGAVAQLKGGWGGPDLDGFVSHWSSQRHRLEACGFTLTRMASALRRNAAAQDTASGASGGSMGGGSGGSVGPARAADYSGQTVGPSGGGYGVGGNGHSSWAATMKGKSPKANDYDLALISADVYDDKYKLFDLDGPNPEVEGKYGNYDKLTPKDITGLGLDPDDFVDPQTGLQAALYVDEAGNYVLAYAGTEITDGGDLVADVLGTNLNPVINMPNPQYMQAAALAVKVQKALGPEAGNLVITGHSLGGGEAAVASIATGAPAVTFNAAGPSDGSIAFAQQLAGDDSGVGSAKDGLSASGQVRAYSTAFDPVTGLQEGGGIDWTAPDALGTQLVFATPKVYAEVYGITFTSKSEHSINTVVDDMADGTYVDTVTPRAK